MVLRLVAGSASALLGMCQRDHDLKRLHYVNCRLIDRKKLKCIQA